MFYYQILFYLSLILLISVLLLYLGRNKTYLNLLSELKENRLHLIRLNSLRASMLEITQAIVGTEDPKDLYEMILEKAIQAVPNANVGSVMIREQDGLFHCFSQKGFDNNKIDDFTLALEDTIIYKFTKGNISKTEIINDLEMIEGLEIFPLTVDEEEWHIQSSISVPLFVEKNLKGLVHIDSKERNAFSEEDRTAMEYIRVNLEVALQKFLLYKKMVTLSRFDELTKTYNRAYFMEHFHHIHNNAQRYKTSFSLGIFDINDLKKINDTYGHIAGDRILQEFSRVTLANIRKTDIFARWGGDEFMALFYEIDDIDISEKITKIRTSLREHPIELEKERIFASFSFGSAQFPDEGLDFDRLLKIADNRMYIDKKEQKKI